jgi:hypothetical protein
MNRWNFGKVTPCEFAVFLAVGQKYYLTKPRFKADFGSFCDPRQRTTFNFATLRGAIGWKTATTPMTARSADFADGRAAFAERRKPVFVGQ